MTNLRALNNLNSDIITIGQTLKVPSSINDETSEDTYTVQPGDTLYAIAKKFNLSVDELKRINNLTSNTLSIGQVLNIRKTNTETPDNNIPTGITYKVQKGDSLYSIAKKFNINVNDLIKANNLLNTTIKIGDELTIPGVSSDNTYTVVSGDSLYSIAKKFQTTVDELKKLNNLTSNLLKIGEILLIK